MTDHRRDTVVIGASSGGVQALRHLLTGLPADLEAAVLIVLHQSERGGQLAEVLRPATALPLVRVEVPQPLASGHVYVAPPDRHMVIENGHVLLTHGPREMRTRPAINPLFRTAAAARGGRVIAVQLTGLLDDGVAGLAAVRRCGGVTLAQDPSDAEYPEMPQSAIDAGVIDRVAPLEALPELIARLVGEIAPSVPVPEDIAIEAHLSGPAPSRPAAMALIGEQIPAACPDCGGPLWQIGHGDTATYRCHVGHAMSGRVLLGAQSEDIERSLWVAVRSLSERAATLSKLADNAERGGTRSAEGYRTRAEEAMAHSETARRFLLSLRQEAAFGSAGEAAVEEAGTAIGE